MATWRATVGTGEYQANEKHTALLPPLWPSDGSRRGCLYFPGFGASAEAMLSAEHRGIPQAVVDRRLPIASFDYGGNALWGNDTARTRSATAWAFAKSRFGCKTDKALLLAGSMGAATALRFALANLAFIAAIALLIPAADLQDIYDNDRGGYRMSIDAAYGGRPSDAQNPFDQAALLAGIPMTAWYSTDDTICDPDAVEAFCAASGAEPRSLGAAGHSTGGLRGSEVASFLAAHA